jgi:uncharacterized protein YdhG (YjbR/CyaY superfamily)
MSPKKATQKSTKSTTAINKKSKGFTDEERAAMKERAQELEAEARRGTRAKKNKADGESEVLAKIAEMPEPDRSMAKRLHAIIKASAPALSPRTWYGMPAYAKDGAEGVDRCRRGKDRRAREESGELRTDLATGPRPWVVRSSNKPNDLILLAEYEDAARARQLF